jgi:hypothetical protein
MAAIEAAFRMDFLLLVWIQSSKSEVAEVCEFGLGGDAGALAEADGD